MELNRFSKKKSEDEGHHQANLLHLYRNPPPQHHDESNWLVSYADMMTLLCGFFVLLFSIAKVDEQKYEKVREAVAEKFGGQFAAPNPELGKFATQFIEQLGIEQQASVRVDPRGVAITLNSTLLFDTLSAEVQPAGVPVLEKVISQLQALQSSEKTEYRVVVEGHTDSRAILGGPFPSNWELSSARASRVVRMFLDRGFKANHLTAIGYSDTYPLYTERTPVGEWDANALARNRRVVIWVLRPEVDQIPLPEAIRSAAAAPPVPAEPARDPAAQAAPAPAQPAAAPAAAPVK